MLCWRPASTPSTPKPKPVLTAISPTEITAQATMISAKVNPACPERIFSRRNACMV